MVEVRRVDFELNYSVKMIARIAHCLNGYVRAMAFAGVNSENVTKLAVAGSSGAVQEFHLKFDVDENIVRCVVLDQVEVLLSFHSRFIMFLVVSFDTYLHPFFRHYQQIRCQ